MRVATFFLLVHGLSARRGRAGGASYRPMSDAPEEEVPKAVKTPRKRPARRVSKPAAAAAETVVSLAAPEPVAPVEKEPAPAPAPASEKVEVESRAAASRPAPESSDNSDPVATFAEPPSSDAQGGGSKKRRRRKKKHGQPASQGGGSPQIFQTAPTQGYAVTSASVSQEAAPAPAEGGHHPTAMHAAPRPKLDAEEIAKKAWKIFLAEVSEEGLALIGDNDARELSRRSFRLAEVFVEEAARRAHR